MLFVGSKQHTVHIVAFAYKPNGEKNVRKCANENYVIGGENES